MQDCCDVRNEYVKENEVLMKEEGVTGKKCDGGGTSTRKLVEKLLEEENEVVVVEKESVVYRK